jgi:stage V sporulation protein D (sporulation-specific penicillin-binding protein)
MFFEKVNFRIKLVFSFITLFFLMVVLKVGYIQIIEYRKLNTLAYDLWGRNLPIEGDRGRILDRNGVVLADNLTTTSLILVPNQIENKGEVAKDLAKILNVSYEEMYSHVSKETSIERVHPEGRRLSYDIAEKIYNLHHKGVYLVKESKRYYPHDYKLSHVLGYVGIDNQGLSGIELVYDSYLMGENGSIKYFSDAKGGRLEMAEEYVQPQKGMDIMLTIDFRIQTMIERELDNTVARYNPDHALILAMDPKTGEILGMSARPTFSPNNYQNYSKEVINRNLPIWMTYEPGSTFKIITYAAAINEGVVDIFKDTFYDTGGVTVEGERLKCWKKGGHGHQTFLQVIQNSCNPGFVELGMRLGADRLFDYIELFGFGNKTGIDLNGEGTGIIFEKEDVGLVELGTTAFGQAVSVTPIQQVTAVSAAINGGYLMQPYIVKMIMEPETKSAMQINKPVIRRQVIMEKTSEIVRYALESVVAQGEGKNGFVEGYRVGGKTGTAQKVKDGRYMVGNYIVSFICFAPADDPKIVLYVSLDNPKGVVQYGGVVAAPIAKTIIGGVVDILGIKPEKTSFTRAYNWYNARYYEVPNVVGMKVKDAMPLLRRFKVEFSGNGDIIIAQSPHGGTSTKERGIVHLFVGNE